MEEEKKTKYEIPPDPYANSPLAENLKRVAPKMVPVKMDWTPGTKRTREQFGLETNEWGQFVHPDTGRPICGAKTSKGTPCMRSPVRGKKRCPKHGGKSTGPKTEEGRKRALANLRPFASMIHGLYAKKPITEAEQAFYDHVMTEWPERYGLDDSDLMLLEKAVMAFIQQTRLDSKFLVEDGFVLKRGDTVVDASSRFLNYMKELGLTRKFRLTQDGNQKAAESLAKILAGISDDE